MPDKVLSLKRRSKAHQPVTNGVMDFALSLKFCDKPKRLAMADALSSE